MPQYVNAYQDWYGKETLEIKKTASWLASTLLWLPIFMATLALSMELLPRDIDAWQPKNYAILCGISVIFWLFTGIFSHFDVDDGMVGWTIFISAGFVVGIGVIGIAAGVSASIGVTIGMGSAVAAIIVGGAGGAGILGGVIITGGVVGAAWGAIFAGISIDMVGAVGGTGFTGLTAGVGVSLVVGNSIKNNQPSFIARTFFVLLIASYIFLLEYFYFGVWHAFV